MLRKLDRIHNNTMSVYVNKKCMNIAMFDNNSNVFYADMISDYLSKDEILQKLDNFNKMYYAWVQLQKKGGRHE